MDGRTLFGWLLLMAGAALTPDTVMAKEKEVEAYVGTKATLTCRVDTDQCGILHSVKWYRDTSRIYVLTQTGHFKGEEDVTKRMNVTYNETEKQTSLKINPVDIDDESTYKCEITYIEVRENCDVVQIVKLTTLVKPDAAHIYGYDGKEVEKFGKLEPRDEGAEVSLTCSAEGKPVPTISWYNGSQPMNRASYSTKLTNSTGRGIGISKLQLILSRGDLDARYKCEVQSQALKEPMVSWVTVDVRVAPTKMVLSGSERVVKQGDKVTLICTVYGAQPEATIWWVNGTTNVTNNNGSNSVIETRSEKADDGTNTTISNLIFTASRWENNQYFKCYARNEVMIRKNNPPLYQALILDVRFPPVIIVMASATTLNETDDVVLTCNYYANPQKLLEATWLKDGNEFPRKEGKHLHGNKDHPSLTIKKISREDMGEYTCKLGNEVGETKSEPIFLDVLYPPEVEVVMDPPGPVKEKDQKNVTLYCNVTTGNPSWLRKVRWNLDDNLIADLPECNETQSEINGSLGGKFCGIDPSILSLINVDQNFAGNYTCQGENDAGRYGRVSEPQELVVYYPPSKAKLRHYPSTVIKKGSVTLECKVDNPGRPDNLTYVWYRGTHLVHNSTDSKWTIHQVSLETRNNFTCYAVNEGGEGEGATVEIQVLAPPAFIGNLNSYKGVLYSANNISLTCRIECYPLCSIIWFKDGHRLDTSNNPLYSVVNKEYGPDYNKNDFESIESTLIWNMENWPNRQLNKSAPHSHYTCASISKETQRPNVTFTTEIAVDFPPEDLVVSKVVVDVIENEIPDSVKCSGKGRPKLSYVWKKNSTLEPIGKDDTLQLDKMPRSAAGYYTCEAFNKYGNKSVNVYFNVLYKPECSIEIRDIEGKQALICSAEANPKNVSYAWTIQENNETIEYNDAIVKADFSYIELDSTVASDRTYRCIANNSVGPSEACHRKIPGNSRAAWYLDSHNLIVLVASIIALIICVIIVCIVIIVLCRKKRQNAKSPNPSSTGDKMRLGAAPPVGGSADPANDHDKAFYENLPFHGMQNPPNKPYRPGFNDLEYADVDYKYGPINYKAASIYAAMKRNKNNNRMEEVNKPNDDLL